LIPPGYVNELITNAPKPVTLHSFVRKLNVAQNTGSIPKLATAASVGWGTEGATIGGGDPAFGQETYDCNRMEALIAFTRELADDSNPDAVEWVAEELGRAIIAERDRVIAIGNGVGQPLGIYSASGITNVNITTLTYENLVTLKETVADRYHGDPSFVWMMNQSVKSACMRIVDDNGRPILVNDATTGWVPRILGAPVVVESSFPNSFIGVGALRFYIWFDRQANLIERSTEAGDAFAKHLILLKAIERVDGKPVLPPVVPMARSRVLTGIA